MKTHPIYEETTGGIGICWGFDTVCNNQGQCATCTLNKEYDEYLNNEETGQSTFNTHTCIDYLEGQCMLHNKPCKNKLACQDYFSKHSDPIDKDPWYTSLDLAEEPFSTFEYDPDYSPLIDRDAYTF